MTAASHSLALCGVVYVVLELVELAMSSSESESRAGAGAGRCTGRTGAGGLATIGSSMKSAARLAAY